MSRTGRKPITVPADVDVKIDDDVEEEEDKGYYDDEIKGAEEIASDEDEDEDNE